MYVAHKCESDPSFGATKLNKVLFFVDFLAYARHGEPVTGSTYMKLRHGPAPRRFVPVRDSLVRHGDAVERDVLHFTHTRRQLVPLRRADLSAFTGPEIALVDEVIEDLCGKSASEVSALSHEFPGWKLAEDGEDIPYYSALIPTRSEPLPPEVIDYGAELAARL